MMPQNCGADTRVCRVETRLDACSWSAVNSEASVETSLDAAGQGPAPQLGQQYTKGKVK